MYARLSRSIALVFGCMLLAHGTGPGALGPWNVTTGTTVARSMLGAATYNGNLYAVGGYYEDVYGDNGSTLATVEFAPLGADGNVGIWSPTTSLPAAVAMAGVIAHNGFLYVAGGSSQLNGATSRTVYFAPIKGDGSIGKWKTTSSLQVAELLLIHFRMIPVVLNPP